MSRVHVTVVNQHSRELEKVLRRTGRKETDKKRRKKVINYLFHTGHEWWLCVGYVSRDIFSTSGTEFDAF